MPNSVQIHTEVWPDIRNRETDRLSFLALFSSFIATNYVSVEFILPAVIYIAGVAARPTSWALAAGEFQADRLPVR